MCNVQFQIKASIIMVIDLLYNNTTESKVVTFVYAVLRVFAETLTYITHLQSIEKDSENDEKW